MSAMQQDQGQNGTATNNVNQLGSTELNTSVERKEEKDYSEDHIESSQCYCGEERNEITVKDNVQKWICHQCWKLMRSRIGFGCPSLPKCRNTIGDDLPIICSKCAHADRNTLTNIMNENQTVVKLMNVALDKIG